MQSHVDSGAVAQDPAVPPRGLVRLAGRLASPGDVDDLVQSTMVRALEFDGDVREREAWLRRVLVNERAMQLRADRRREAREIAATNDPELDVEQVVQCIEVARIVGELIDGLDEPVRKVIRARFFDDESSADIARKQGVPAGTVRWRLKTGLDRLRRELDARHGGRRAVWAGVFGPTIAGPVASGGSEGGAMAAAAPKGTMMFGIKMMVGVALAAGAVGGVSAIVRSRDVDPVVTSTAGASTPASSTTTTSADTATSANKAISANTATPSVRERGEAMAARGRWEGRRRDIRAHHRARAGAEGVPAPSLGTCDDPACFQNLVAEVTNLVESCRDFVGDTKGDARLVANIIGSPDVGTIVESVELVGGEDVPPDLRECLTETMYAMDLGPASSDFEQQLEMQLSTMPADGDVDWAGIDPAVQAELERAIAEAKADASGKGAGVRAVHVDAHTTPPDAMPQ